MGYELRIIPNCPNSAPALDLFRAALLAEDLDPGDIRVLELVSDEQAEQLGFHGSPTFVSGGRDLFASSAAPALSCRVYPSGDGLAGLPSVEDLRAALRR